MISSDFDGKLMQSKATWDCFVPGFHEWFVDHFRLHLIRSITQSANVEGHFTNNHIESVNNNVKSWLGRVGNLSFVVANSKLEELVISRQQEFEIPVFGNGTYEMAKCYESLREKRYVWNAMSAEERRDATMKF
jgi:hypothetical protein